MNISDGQWLLFPPAPPLASRLGVDFFRSVPERPGVYLMSAPQEGVLYVGKAKNLRRRLANHGSAPTERLSRKIRRLLARVERIDWDECEDEAAAIVRERELIRALQPSFNTVGVRAPKQWFIGWRRHGSSVELALAENLDDWPCVHGPFAFARPVFAALLRNCWLETHPGNSVAQLPLQLLAASPPARWRFDGSAAVEQWVVELAALLAGRESRLLPASPSEEPPYPGTFDEQWLAKDTECLSEFWARLRNKEVDENKD